MSSVAWCQGLYLGQVYQIFKCNEPCPPEVGGWIPLLPAHVHPPGIHQGRAGLSGECMTPQQPEQLLVAAVLTFIGLLYSALK